MEQPSFDELLEQFRGRRILIVGDVMMDEYVWGEVRRISPEAPVPVVEMRRRTYVPGGAANSAANVVSLSGRASLAGVVGDDSSGQLLRNLLSDRSVETDGLTTSVGRRTTIKTRIVAQNQQVVRLDTETSVPLSIEDENRLIAWLDEQVPQSVACILSDYGKGVVSVRVAERLIDLARSSGKPVVIDPKGADYRKYRGATVIKPNVYEAERVIKHEITNDKELRDAGQRLVDLLDGCAVLITRGPQGMLLCLPDHRQMDISTVAQKVFDVTGAGDTVVSTLAVSLAAGATLEVAVFLANAAAGIVVGKLGTATVTNEELRRTIAILPRFLPESKNAIPNHSGTRTSGPEKLFPRLPQHCDRATPHNHVAVAVAIDRAAVTNNCSATLASFPKVIDWDQLLALRQIARTHGQTVVWTNGCFDLLHLGHVRNLQAAKSFGDILIVGLNNDESVRQLKGPSRPIVPAAQRAEILAALECVSHVVIFDEPTAETSILRLEPDVLAKGSDYAPPQGKPIPEAELVRSYGGRVQYFPLVPEISTSDIVRRIRE